MTRVDTESVMLAENSDTVTASRFWNLKSTSRAVKDTISPM
jgi:hypothetical protein